MNAFDYEALWGKSAVFIKRGLRDRAAGDYSGFQLWAALALELLGKAALSRVHPALVADPTHQESLFAACGKPAGVERRTITAKTVFERIQRVNKRFDAPARDFCMSFANRRNSELHSGEAPYEAMKMEAWVPQYWKTVALLLEAQARTLEEWVGAEEAKIAQEVINDAVTALQQAIAGRVREHRDAFSERFPENSRPREEVKTRNGGGALVHWRDFAPRYWEHMVSKPCPACGCDGIAAGDSVDEEILETADEDTWVELVEYTCVAEAFRCHACGLKLDGVDEIEAAEFGTEFKVVKEREPEYEPEYGND